MKRVIVCLVFVVGAFLLPLTMEAGQSGRAAPRMVASHEKEPVFASISPMEAKKMIDSRKDLLLVDVRNPSELQEGYIQGSTLIPLWEIVKGHRSIPKDRPVLLICAVGGRSLGLGKLMVRYDWPEVYSLEGGIAAWREAGLPLLY